MNGEAPIELVPDRAQLSAALRELEQAKARVERDARQVADETKKQLVSQLLPVMDNLDRAIKAAEHDGDTPAVIEGITLVRSQLEGVLRGYGVERIDALAVPFDPASHEAVTTLPVLTAAAHNLVVDQLAPGYRFGTQLLRPAQVVVGKLSQPPQAGLDGNTHRQPLDPYGRPARFDQAGRPIRQAQPPGWVSPLTRRAR
jgi:molecular chaperone GrpE